MIHPGYSQLPDWTGQTVAIIGGGPSLDPVQVAQCRGRCYVIAVNYAFTLAPWADWVHGFDQWFWRKYGGELAGFPGLKTCGQSPSSRPGPVVHQVPMAPRDIGRPFADPVLPIHQGYESGYQAIQLAAWCGARFILLLGFDGQPNGRWHDQYPERSFSEYDNSLPLHRALKSLLDERGCTVINTSLESAIDAYEKRPFGEWLGCVGQ